MSKWEEESKEGPPTTGGENQYNRSEKWSRGEVWRDGGQNGGGMLCKEGGK